MKQNSPPATDVASEESLAEKSSSPGNSWRPRFLRTCRRVPVAQSTLRCSVSALLLASAAMKVDALLTRPIGASALAVPAWMLDAAIALEVFIGVWLALKPFSGKNWAASTVTFFVFSQVSLYSALQGGEVCGCFGALAISPWLTFFVDLSILAALVSCAPLVRWQRFQISRLGKAAVFVLVGIAGGLSIWLITAGLTANIRAHSQARRATGAASSSVVRSLGPNMNVILSPVGKHNFDFRLPTYRGNNVAGFLAHAAQHFDNSVVQSAVAWDDLTDMQQDALDRPLIAAVESGKAVVVLGSVRDEGRSYYQVLDGAGAPFLIPTEILDAAVTDLRELIVADAQPASTDGVLVDFGDARLKIDRLFHSFGVVRPYEHKTTEFLLSNIGTTAIELGDIDVSCSCTKAAFTSDAKSLAPGASVKLGASVDIARSNVRQSLTFTVEDAATGESQKVRLLLFGSQLETLRVSVTSLNLGRLRPGGSAKRLVRLTETTTDRFQITGVDSAELPLSWSISEGRALGDGLHDYGIELTLQPGELAPGKHSGVVRIHTTSERTPYVDVRCRVEVLSRVRLSPSVVSFGNVEHGSNSSRSVTITVHDADQTCRISPAGEKNGAFEIARLNQVREGVYEAEIALTASASGNVSEVVEFSVSAGSWSESVSVPCVAFVMN